MVHLIEDEDVQVTEVARHQVGHDLALTVRQDLVTAGIAVKDEMNPLGNMAFLDEVRTCGHLAHAGNEGSQRSSIAVGEVLEALKLADQGILHRATVAKGNIVP